MPLQGLARKLKTSSRENSALCVRLAIALFGVVLDYALVPSLYTSSTIWFFVAFLALAYRTKADGGGIHPLQGTEIFPWRRLPTFAMLHVVLLVASRGFDQILSAASASYSLIGTLSVATKLAVLLPSLCLIPVSKVRDTLRWYRAELIAALVVLLTFFPNRLFGLVWPHYSKWLGLIVYRICLMVAPMLQYFPGVDPTITGPRLDVTITYWCGGIDGLNLFDRLFGLLVLLDWNRVRKVRTLGAYAIGVAAMLCANVLRIVLLVLCGNLISPDFIVQYHIDAGWVLLAVAFLAFLCFAYPWISKPAIARINYKAARVMDPECQRSAQT